MEQKLALAQMAAAIIDLAINQAGMAMLASCAPLKVSLLVLCIIMQYTHAWAVISINVGH